MKLKDITNTDTEKYSPGSNRFVVFDRNGHELYVCDRNEGKYLETETLWTKKSSYSSSLWNVGFPTTHIMLNVTAPKEDWAVCPIKFGQIDERN